MSVMWSYNGEDWVSESERRAFENFKKELIRRGANNSQADSRIADICYRIITENADVPFQLMRDKLVEVTKSIDAEYNRLEQELIALQGAREEVKQVAASVAQIKTPTASLESSNAKDMLTMFSYILQLGKEYEASPDVTMRCASYAAWALCNTGVPIPKELNEETPKENKK